jgi:DNA repair exonuclease SbcCD ATPase subunit
VAAAKVDELMTAIALLGDNPLLEAAKKELEKELQKQTRLARDNRSTAKKIDQKQSWVEREVKRIAEETKRIQEAQQALVCRQEVLKTEMANIEKLREELVTNGGSKDIEEMDVYADLTPEKVAELKHMEDKELNLRRSVARKRAMGAAENAPEAGPSEVAEWEAEANTILTEIESAKKRLRSAASKVATGPPANGN